MRACQTCTSEVDAYLCRTCADDLGERVRALPWLINQLELVRSRQTNVYRANGHRMASYDDGDDPGSSLSLRASAGPANLDATELLWDAGNTIAAWTTHLAREHRLHSLPAPHEVLDWYARNVYRMTLDPAAGQCHDEISYLYRSLLRAIDRSPERLYAGPCRAPRSVGKCPLDLYSLPGRDTVRCDGYRAGTDGCGTEHTLTDRREFLVAEVQVSILPLAVLVDALGWLLPHEALPSPTTWRIWRHRQRLVSVGTDRTGTVLYRGADVLNLAQDRKVRTGQKRASARG